MTDNEMYCAKIIHTSFIHLSRYSGGGTGSFPPGPGQPLPPGFKDLDFGSDLEDEDDDDDLMETTTVPDSPKSTASNDTDSVSYTPSSTTFVDHRS